MCLLKRSSKILAAPTALNLLRNDWRLISELDLRPIYLGTFHLNGEQQANADLRHLSVIEDYDDRIHRHHDATLQSNQAEIIYLDTRLFDWLRGSVNRIKSTYAFINKSLQHLKWKTGSRTMIEQYFNPSSIRNLDHSGYYLDASQATQVVNLVDRELDRREPRNIELSCNKARTVKVLRTSRWLNILLVILYGFLVIGYLYSTLKLHLRYPNDEPETFGSRSMTTEQFGDASTSWARLRNTPPLSYFFMLVTTMDLLNALHWFHHMDKSSREERIIRGGYVSKDRQENWIWAVFDIISNPRHLFKIFHASLLIYPASSGLLSDLTNLLISWNQLVWHGYNLYRVRNYLRSLQGSSRTEVRPDRDYSTTTNHCCCKWSGHAGWSRWPLDLFKCCCRWQSSWQFWFERLLMMSQTWAIKLRLMSLLLEVDEKKLAPGLFLMVSVLASISAIYSYYNKYHLRYAREEQPVEE